ncbi:hypothetical protein RRG08_030608 [Elysia crispata]|uniref:Sodium-coupled monocarboxylate transporter 2 n=2 Tax=Elysia crispata TaxID=231223 RepID=A0AAE0Y402_9GAST|nr:hypothetical protein RRG08_030608 [Elysia crispata]
MATPSCFRPGVRVEPKFDGDYTFNTGHVKSFTILDYTIFLLSLLIPILIGFHQAWQGNTELVYYMLARRSMSYIPVGLSLLASFLSAITIIGVPAEIYEHDTLYVWVGLSFCIVSAASAHIYMPVFYKLKINSVYEYLELRFSRKVRAVGSCLFVIQMVVYMAIVLYAPSITFNAVTGLNLWAAIVSVGLVCTLYVTVGGVRTVIWTDSFQIFVMFGSALAMLFAAMATVGTTTMWESAQRTERVLFLDFGLNPTLRHSVWNLFFGGGFSYLALYVNQTQVYRCQTCRTLREVKIALWMSFPGHFLYLTLCLIIGLCMGAFYENCDPLQAKLVANANELTPLFAQDILSIVPGLPGIYLAGVFSATLSTMSSGLNSISIVILEDYIRVYVKSKLQQDKQRLILQIISVIFGFVCLEITFLVSKFGGILEVKILNALDTQDIH